MVAILTLTFSTPKAVAEEISLVRDDARISTSTTIGRRVHRAVDQAGDGAVQIMGDDLTVDFQGAQLVGCDDQRQPNELSGTGIVIRGRNITLRNAKIRGYKVGIHAETAPGLLLEDIDVSDNFRQRLGSTPDAEDAADWLYPHENDNHEWMTRYGAGVYVEKSDGVTIRRIRARRGQNGIILDRVNDSKIYDNDCSFLSGWGLALWRSNRNTITHNSFDFCVRGYSHGVYNRGQDSAGVLMFEQCSNNYVIENSATHGGDGFFGFGGNESLAGRGRTGNNANLLAGNDFSYAAAHGIEMTFSFENHLRDNRLVGNAICGIWAGYSQDTIIAGNNIQNNGEAGYGHEGGGVNIEHGRGNIVAQNKFTANRCGVYLWSDDDGELLKKPWCVANHRGSVDNFIQGNGFNDERTAVRLRQTSRTCVDHNGFTNVTSQIDADPASDVMIQMNEAIAPAPAVTVLGETRPVGKRSNLQGRDQIVMTEWGPYDFAEPLITPTAAHGSGRIVLRALGSTGTFKVTAVRGDVKVSPATGTLPGEIVAEKTEPGLHQFELEVHAGGKQLRAGGVLVNTEWTVKFFQWQPADDPREHPDRWDALLASPPIETLTLPRIDFRWAGGAPSDKVPRDRFGTLATTQIQLAAGRYELSTVSDDGIRVWVDSQQIIDDWTWHGPTPHDATLTLEAGLHTFRIEHFEIDGYAQLQFRLEPVESAP